MSDSKAQAGKMRGKQSVCFTNPPIVLGVSSVAGQKEGEGPLGAYFDVISEDPMFGGETWEDAESKLLLQAAELAIQNSGLKKTDIRYLVGGDLLGQLIATSFGVESLDIPLLGVYGACSTMGESIAIASMLVEGGYGDRILALTSSHFGGAEKQFRFPLAYGNQRPLAATWTVTGSGGVVIGKSDLQPKNWQGKTIRVKGLTIGKIVDYGIKDSMNMGACMAPSAASTIAQHFKDFNSKPEDYDKIITGDLGLVGSNILIELLDNEGFDASKNHMDCGIEIYDTEVQDTHSGGSGCGCSAITLTGYVMKQLSQEKWKKVLFVPTGALLSTVSFNEGQSVPGIAHAVVFEADC